MLRAKIEGILNPYQRMDEVAPAGRIVMLDSANAGKVKVSDGHDAFGILSQDVVGKPANGYKSPVDSTAWPGEKVGVYHGGGIYETDQFVSGTYAPGAPLYVTSEGKLTDVKDTQTTPAPTTATGILQVGVAVSLANGVLVFKLTI